MLTHTTTVADLIAALSEMDPDAVLTLSVGTAKTTTGGKSASGPTRNDWVAHLKAAGYTGPTSYLKSRLAEIAAVWVLCTMTLSDADRGIPTRMIPAQELAEAEAV